MFAENWCIKSNERIYGPYSSNDLRKFVHEGRFAAWSLVAPAGSREFREARLEPAFAQLFGMEAPPSAARAFGRQVDAKSPKIDNHADAETVEPRRAKPLRRDIKSTAPASSQSTDQKTAANFVIIFDIVNAAASRVESALMSLGTAFRLADNVWSVTCPLTAIGVRNAIAPFLRPHETLFVIDATNGRTSWQNYAPETHAKITQSYMHGRHG